MSENVAITPGAGATIATDDCTVNAVAVQVQRIKAGWGADSVYNDPAVAAPLPVQASIESSQMTNAGAILTPHFAVISDNTSGGSAIVAADASHKIRVIAYVMVADAAVTAKFQSGTTDLTGPMSLSATGGAVAPFCPVGWFETAVNQALNLNLSVALGVRGHLTYVLI